MDFSDNESTSSSHEEQQVDKSPQDGQSTSNQSPPDGPTLNLLDGVDKDSPESPKRAKKREYPFLEDLIQYDLVSLVEGEEHEQAWELPNPLAKYFNLQAKNLIPTKKLKENIYDVHPVPSNILKKPKLDNFLAKMIPILLGGRGNRQLQRDKSMEEVWESVINIMGPLGRLWGEIEAKYSSTSRIIG